MNLEIFHIPAYITVVLAAAIMLTVPLVSMAMSKTPFQVPTGSSDSQDGAACELPPVVEIERARSDTYMEELPPMDRQEVENLKTATFALG